MKDFALAAQQWYSQTQTPRALADALLRCFFYGAIVDRPKMLVMIEPCYTDGKLILPPPNKWNCWWVHFAAYDSSEVSLYDILNEAPYPLEYVAFRRRAKMRIHTWEQLRRDIYGRSPVSITAAAD
jgi:hypothetical protein